jgi:hypothetical protein
MRYIIWFPWSPYSRWRAKREGRLDGEVGTDHVLYESRLLNFGEQEAGRIAQEWEGLDKGLKGEYCTARARWRAAQEELETAKQDRETASKDHEEARKKEEPILGRHSLKTWIYIPLMIILGLAEFPLNAIAFRTAGEPELMTYMMTLSLALVLPLSAHFLGVFLRHAALTKREYALTGLAILIPLAAIAGVAYVRDKYIEEAQKVLGIQLDPTTVVLIFVAINLLIFLVGVLASYFAHDPQVVEQSKRLKETFKRLRQACARLAGTRKVFSQAEQRYHAITAMRQNAFDEKKHQVGEINDIVQELIAVYRHRYARTARLAQQTAAFGLMPKIEIPEAFHQLDWECAQVSEDGEPVAEVSQEPVAALESLSDARREEGGSPTSASPSEPVPEEVSNLQSQILSSQAPAAAPEPVSEMPQPEIETPRGITPRLYEEKERVK